MKTADEIVAVIVERRAELEKVIADARAELTKLRGFGGVGGRGGGRGARKLILEAVADGKTSAQVRDCVPHLSKVTVANALYALQKSGALRREDGAGRRGGIYRRVDGQ